MTGLLRAVKGALRETHLREWSGWTVAVDTSCLLHRGATLCARELCELGADGCDEYLHFLQRRVRLLRSLGVEPVMVLDGAPAPCKAREDAARARERSTQLSRARALEADCNTSAALESYLKAVHISQRMRDRAVDTLRSLGVRIIVSPFEADAQLAYLELTGFVHAVLTEDSDLVPLGCRRILFKLDKHGWCSELRRECLSTPICNSLNFSGFTKSMLVATCALSGCDYFAGVHGIGVKRARDIVRQRRTPERISQKLRMNGCSVPSDFTERLRDAILAFSHPWVYCPQADAFVRLWPIDEMAIGESTLARLSSIVGTPPSQNKARLVADGTLDPVTLEPSTVCTASEGSQTRIDTFFAPTPRHGWKGKRQSDRKSSHDWEAEAVCKRADATRANAACGEAFDAAATAQETQSADPDPRALDDVGPTAPMPSERPIDESDEGFALIQHRDQAILNAKAADIEGVKRTEGAAWPSTSGVPAPVTSYGFNTNSVQGSKACKMPRTSLDRGMKRKRKLGMGASRFFSQKGVQQYEQDAKCAEDETAGSGDHEPLNQAGGKSQGEDRVPLSALSPNAKSHKERLEHYALVARSTIDKVVGGQEHGDVASLEHFRLTSHAKR